MKKPPRDGTMIIAEFKNNPTHLAAIWNPVDSKWAAAVPNAEPYHGVWNDWYFENESFSEEELVEWWPIEEPSKEFEKQIDRYFSEITDEQLRLDLEVAGYEFYKQVNIQILDECEENKIKPCPFCGTEPGIGIHNPKVDGKYQYQIRCESGNCPMDYVGGHGFATKEDVITAWNKRKENE